MNNNDAQILREIIAKQAALETQVRRMATKDAAGGYWVSMPPYIGAGGPPMNAALAATTTVAMFPPARPLTLKRLVVTTHTATTNNAGNHWTLKITNGLGPTVLAAQSLEADTVATWTVHTYSTFDLPDLATADLYVILVATKVGTPGNLTLSTPLLFFI